MCIKYISPTSLEEAKANVRLAKHMSAEGDRLREKYRKLTSKAGELAMGIAHGTSFLPKVREEWPGVLLIFENAQGQEIYAAVEYDSNIEQYDVYYQVNNSKGEELTEIEYRSFGQEVADEIREILLNGLRIDQ